MFADRQFFPRSTTAASALAAARRVLDDIDARTLLRHTLKTNDARLIANPDHTLTTAEQQRFGDFVARRAAGEPIAYLIGEREFFGRTFKITPAVLIPRPETELLVEFALEHISRDQPCRILDLGTGSGCVAISIACECPRAHVIATDVNAAALAVARDNARAMALTNMAFIQGDWFEPLAEKSFDVIVCNPPYVAAGDPHLKDLRCEPSSALISGVDGLEAIRKIAAVAPRHLMPGGWLGFEHGYDQAVHTSALLATAGLKDIFSRHDLAGVERISGGHLPKDMANP